MVFMTTILLTVWYICLKGLSKKKNIFSILLAQQSPICEKTGVKMGVRLEINLIDIIISAIKAEKCIINAMGQGEGQTHGWGLWMKWSKGKMAGQQSAQPTKT